MRASNVLRVCVLADWILIVAIVATSILLESDLPGPLLDWQTAEDERGMTQFDLILFAIIAPFLGCYLAGGFGLLLLKRWGAWLLIWSLAVVWLATFFMGPTVEHAVPYALAALRTFVIGVMVGLAFFSNALAGERVVEHGSDQA